MKITKQKLIQIIEEELSEISREYTPGKMTKATEMDIDKPDPMDVLFRIMDAITDKALVILKGDLGDKFDYMEVEKQLSPLSNEVVTRRLHDDGRVDQMDSMANELASRYLRMDAFGQEHPEALEEEISSGKKKFSKIKPFKSATVFFDKNAGAKPLAPRMVRVKASIDMSGTKALKKNYQKNMVSLQIMRDTIDLKGNYSAQPVYVKLPGDAIDPDDEGRFVDIEGWRLRKLGLTDKYNNLLDNQGNIIATKKQQNKFSGA